MLVRLLRICGGVGCEIGGREGFIMVCSSIGGDWFREGSASFVSRSEPQIYRAVWI
jgi:hypothetical protein